MKLTVLHEGLQSGGEVLESISGGWPIVVSKLKTYPRQRSRTGRVPGAALIGM